QTCSTRAHPIGGAFSPACAGGEARVEVDLYKCKSSCRDLCSFGWASISHRAGSGAYEVAISTGSTHAPGPTVEHVDGCGAGHASTTADPTQHHRVELSTAQCQRATTLPMALRLC